MTTATREWTLRDLERWLDDQRRSGRSLPSVEAVVAQRRRRSRRHSYPGLAVEFRNVDPTYEVHLAYSVRLAIEEEIREVLGRYGDVETGGFLFAHRRPRPDSADVSHATGPGKGSRHSSSGLKLASLATVQSGLNEFVKRAGLLAVGDWHSHPASPGQPPDPRPSPHDLRGWTRQREALGMVPFVSLIVTPGGLGWMTPEFHAFVSYRGDDWHIGSDSAEIRHICEPARLNEA